MAQSHYTRGREVEYKIKAQLEGEGYAVVRASSSKGHWDLVAVGPDKIRLISSKRAVSWARAKATYTSERKALKALAGIVPAGAAQELFIWVDKGPDGKGPGRWFCREAIEGCDAVAEKGGTA